MAQQHTPAAGSGILITEATAAKAFEAWETDSRERPEGFYTSEEIARMEVAELSTLNAIHFMALLRQAGAA
jgi:hypothetical protein